HELPDLLAGAGGSGRSEGDELLAVLQRWSVLLGQLRRWQNVAFALRYHCQPAERRVDAAVLLRVSSRPGTVDNVAAAIQRQLAALLSQFNLTTEPLAERAALLQFLAPLERGHLVELRQHEAALPLRAVDQSFYVVYPHAAPNGPWLAPLALALEQRAPTLINLHLEPTQLRADERDTFARKASFAQQLGDGRIGGVMFGTDRVTPDPAAAQAGQLFARNIERLREPFLLTAQVLGADAVSARAVANELALAVALKAPLDRQETAVDARNSAFTRSAPWRTLAELSLADWGATAAPQGQERLRYLVDATTAAAVFRPPITPRDVTKPTPGINEQLLRQRNRPAVGSRSDVSAERLAPLVLTLRFTPRGDTAEVTWEAPEIGHVVTRLDAPYDAATLPLVLAALDVVQSPHYHKYAQEFEVNGPGLLASHGLWDGSRVPADVDRRVGQALYRALVANRDADRALAGMRNYAIAQGRSLSYLLRFAPGAEELAALPWELLRDPAGAALMSGGRQAMCVRYLDLDTALPPPAALGPTLRILAISPAVGVEAEDREADRVARTIAWEPLVRDGLVAVEELRPATIRELVNRLSDGDPVDVLHFYGHGRFQNNHGELRFDPLQTGEGWVSADRFAGLLHTSARPPQLVLLHACHSALGTIGLRTGTGPALIAAGVPAVVAMQLSMRTTAAARFTEKVYRSLARGESLQEAVSIGRQALYSEAEDGASWYVPTLTIRSRDTGPLRLVRPL
ncbi:MAG: CHAT domain-containing protein, partial [Chloroflexales bacterium]|nr:CHAT domain-containing protein [Chloroflexales bacterium]